MKKIFKQYFYEHEIETITESYSPEHMFIVKSIIQCKKCEKTFDQNPHSQCCYVQHVHSEILRDYWTRKIRLGQQQ